MLGGLVWWCIVGLIAGFLAGKVMKGGGFGAQRGSCARAAGN